MSRARVAPARKTARPRDRKELTRARTRAVLDFLRAYEREHGRSPTAREISLGVEIPSTSVVNDYLRRLRASGKIQIQEGIARGIRILDWGDIRVAPGEIGRIPLIGRIVAGEPLPVPDGAELESEYVVVPRERLPYVDVRSLYALEVKGSSMADALIAEGDIVIMRFQQDARDGDMVAAHVKDEDGFTLKYYYRKGREVILQPANRHFKAICKPARDVEIQGKVVLVLRQFQQLA